MDDLTISPGGRRYGWVPDAPDTVRKRYLVAPDVLQALPPAADVLGLLGPTLDQGSLGSCHDGLTDTLTLSGWKRFADLLPTDKLASVCPRTSKLIFELPSRLIRMPYAGEMYYGEHQALDFAVTPDHTMLVRKWDEAKRTLSENYSFVAMKDVGWYCGLMNHVDYDGEDELATHTLKGIVHKLKDQRQDLTVAMSAWMRFLGIYLAEGTMLGKHGPKKFQLAASKEREKSFIRDVLRDLNQNATELSDRFTIQNCRLYAAMEEWGLEGVRAPEKFVPDFVFRLNGEMIREFLLGHFMGDGCEQHGIRSHYTSSPRLAGDLQRLIFLSGGWSGMSARPPRCSRMSDGREVRGVHPEHRVSQWTSRGLSLDRNENVSTSHYEGEVFCAEMPTHHTLVTRRNGKILIAGNCTAHGIAGAIMAERKAQNLPSFVPSRLMIYYLEREMEGTVNQDAGAAIADGLKAVHEVGYCEESLWPYDIARFKQRPPAAAYEASKPNRIVDYASVQNVPEQLKGCIVQGDPVVFGFVVFESFESQEVARSGIMPVPKRREKQLGGHCVYICAYSDSDQMYLCRNSWGADWGTKGGCFWMPYAFMHSGYCSDFWVVKSVPGSVPQPTPSPTPTPQPTPSPAPTGKSRIIIDVDGKVGGATVVFAG